MDDGLKQRLIGAIVLLALLVTFLPVLFDRENIEPVDRESQIPPSPYIEPVVIDVPTEPEVATPAPPPEKMFIPDEATPADPKPEKPALNPTGTPKSWVLQIASYSRSELAEKMRDTLIEDGYRAYIREIKTSAGTMKRLYVGPKLDKRTMLKEKAAIDKKYNIDSLLLEFTPN